MALPSKLPALMPAIRAALERGDYIYSIHALERQNQRKITRSEVVQVLRGGHHEKAKDTYEEAHKAWNYAVRGRTVDKRALRIIVSFDPQGMLIVTAIDLKA
jgi:hypothetical protein